MVPEMATQKSVTPKPSLSKKLKQAEILFMENAQHIQQLKKVLHPNRDLIDKIKQFGLQKI